MAAQPTAEAVAPQLRDLMAYIDARADANGCGGGHEGFYPFAYGATSALTLEAAQIIAGLIAGDEHAATEARGFLNKFTAAVPA